MIPAKKIITDVIKTLPEDASYDEILHELAFNRMVERGLSDVRAGKIVSDDVMRKKISSWQN